MLFDMKSLPKKIKDNINDLTGIEQEEEFSSHLLDSLPMLFPSQLPQVAQSEGLVERLKEEVSKSDKSNIQDCILALMAAAVGERKIFTIHDYERISEYAKELFGEESMHARFQAKLNATLLRDYSKEELQIEALEDFRSFLSLHSDSISFNQDFLDALYAVIYALTLQDKRDLYGIASQFFEKVELIFMEYDIQRKKEQIFLSARSSQLYKSARADIFEKSSKSTNASTRQKIRSTASKLLPGKDLIHKVTGLASDSNEQTYSNTSGLFSFSRQNKKQKTMQNWVQSDVYDKELSALENYGLAFEDNVLLEQIKAFRNLLIPQDFRIVVLGEGKRGKSSVVNALLGKHILPTKAILPETATLVELFYSHENSFEIEWISKEEFIELEKVLYAEEANLLLQKKFENLRKIFDNKELFENLQKLSINRMEDLHEFVSAEGLYTALIKKVRVGIHSSNIPQGILLIDTPALNASDPFYHALTREEALKADCLIVVLDARKPDSYSEIAFLKELAKKGRVLKVIGVLSYPPDSASERELAKKRALQTLQESIREVEEVEIVDVFMFNPKQIVENYEKNIILSSLSKIQKQLFEGDYLAFVEGITKCVNEGIQSSLFSQRLESTFQHLVSFAETNREEFLGQHEKNLPIKQHQEMLLNHSKHLATATEKYADHARALVLNVHHDIENWRENSERNIMLLEERIVLHITRAMHKHADSLGDNFSKEANWTEFDTEEAPQIARSLIDEFVTEQRASLHSWEEKIQLFNSNMQELSLECFEEIQKISHDISALAATKSNMDHMIVKSFSYMNRLTLFLGGAGTGLLASSGILNALALGTATLAFLTSPIVIPSALLIGGAAYALRSFAKPSKRKEYFFEKKEVKVREFAKEITQELNNQLDQIQEELILSYSQAVHKSLVPALEIMAGEAVNIHLYLQIVQKQNKELTKSLKELSF